MFSKTQKCQNLKQLLTERSGAVFVDQISHADALLIGGGDGTMLRALRKYGEAGKPFFGVHCGTLGFLMNRRVCVMGDDCEASLATICFDDLDLVHLTSIQVEVQMTTGERILGYAYNDLVLGGNVLDYMHMQIQFGSPETDDAVTLDVSGTGLIITTSLGSTGYALNNGLPLIPLESTLWGVSGLATGSFQYRYTRPGDIHIDIDARRPVMLGLDGTSEVIHQVCAVTLRPGMQQVSICFLKSEQFANRRVLLAEQKLGNKR